MRLLTLFTCLLGIAAAASAGPTTTPSSVLGFKVENIDGKSVDLSQYKGKVLLIVNVASKCGHTPQYAALEKLYEKYKDKGLAILAFPANDFRAQEPGTNAEIREFCTSKYGVTFDLFSKMTVVPGQNQSPLYAFLTSEQANPRTAGPIKWNFTKFLVGRDGQVINRFEPKTKPDEPAVVEAIEAALGSK